MEFALGQILVTSGVNELGLKNSKFEKFIGESLNRHIHCDWGDLCDEDKEMNNSALKNGDDRLFSKYNFDEDTSIYIITEWDRSATTILFPDEY